VILVVSLNPALDVIHHVASANWAGINQPHAVEVQAGGKGLNVARTLRALGQQVMLTGLVGGLTGHALAGGIAAVGIDSALTQIAGETRRIFAVSDTVRGETASFTEPGPAVDAGEYERFFVAYEKRLKSCSAVVLSGSIPRGLPDGAHADLVAAAVAADVLVVLDTRGPALRLGAAARPTMVRASLAELESVAGRSLGAPGRPDIAAVDQATRGLAGFGVADPSARHLPGLGTSSVVVTLGACELLAVCPGGTLLARPPATVTRRPATLGNAAVAGLADGLVRDMGWSDLLAHATALEIASADSPAGTFSEIEYKRTRPAIQITDITGDLVADAGSGLGRVAASTATALS
jgi:tagatose 6-phosphate kinase